MAGSQPAEASPGFGIGSKGAGGLKPKPLLLVGLGLLLAAAPIEDSPARPPVQQKEGPGAAQRRPPADEKKISAFITARVARPITVHRGRDYTIFTDDASMDLPSLGRHLQRTLAYLEKTLDTSLPQAEPSLPVIHFREGKDYRGFCGSLELEKYAVEGYGCYAPGVSFRPVIVQGLALGTLRHEAAHQFVDRAMGPGLRETAWLVEGLGALFESFPPEEFTRYRRYREGRRRILRPEFSLERFVMKTERGDGMYDTGAAVHGIFLFGADRSKYLKWLGDHARKKCAPEDLPRYLGRSWADLGEIVRRFCRENEPSVPDER